MNPHVTAILAGAAFGVAYVVAKYLATRAFKKWSGWL